MSLLREERRVMSSPSVEWPAELERRVGARDRIVRFLLRHAVDFGIVMMMLGLIGLIIGTYNGSRPQWPAPIVWYVTSAATCLVCVFALVCRDKQPRIAAVIGVWITGSMRGIGYILQGPDSGFRIGAAIGAYLITVGACSIIIALAFGEHLEADDHGGRKRWSP